MKGCTVFAAACVMAMTAISPAAANTSDRGYWAVDALLPRADGSVVIAGTFGIESSPDVLFVKRIGADGLSDARFVTASFESSDHRFESVSELPDGRLILSTTGVLTSAGSDLVALLPNGDDDPVLTSAFKELNGHVAAVAVQPDGRILLGGLFTRFGNEPCGYLVRVNPDGTRDRTFNSGGSGPNWPVNAIALTPDGAIMIGGQFFGYNGQAVGPLVRLLPDGHLDSSFAVDPQLNLVLELVPRSDGVVLLGSRWTDETVVSPGLMATTSDGRRDATFEEGQGWEFAGISVQPDGKLLLVIDETVSRLTPDGRVDLGFLKASLWQDGGARSVASFADGRVIFGSSTYRIPTGSPVLSGMHANGRQDKRWSRPGTFVNPRRRPARPSGVKARWEGRHIRVRWDAGPGQTAYAVRVRDKGYLRADATTIVTGARIHWGRPKRVRVCVRAYNPVASSKPTCVERKPPA